jgi:two-component system sensor histidine kinase KdpD
MQAAPDASAITVVRRLAAIIGLVLAASLLATALQRMLGVERIFALYFVAVVLSAAAFGLWHGLLAAGLSTIAFDVVSEGPSFSAALGSKQDLVNAVAFICGAWVAGLYIDEARRERDALARLTRVPDEASSSRALMRLIEVAFFTWPPLAETLRLLAAVFLSLASVGIGSIVSVAVGPLPVSMVYLAGVVSAAVILGARYALITAIFNAIGYDVFVLEPRLSLSLYSQAAGLNLVVFLAVGWQVGRFAERVRYERQAVRSMFEAGSSFSATADEPTLRRLIAEAVSALNGGRYVLVRDERGEGAVEAGPRPAPGRPRAAQSGPIQTTDGHWRTRALKFQASPLGSVTWLHGGSDPDRPVEQTVGALLVLGSAAIARARISRENARLEVVAQAEELRRALLASVSHDFRTPLAGILGSATSLVDLYDKYDEVVRRDLLLNIREQAYRLSRYVENLLGMARVESQILQAKLRPVPLEAFVLETWESIADGLRAERPDVAVPEDIWVMADPVLLRQALSNVLENAAKYTPPDRRVQVAGRRAKGQIILAVSDFGSGAPGEDLEQLFKPFFRARNSKAGGVGLGLFVARNFIEAMGGTIKAERRGGAVTGMIFNLSLPIAEASL